MTVEIENTNTEQSTLNKVESTENIIEETQLTEKAQITEKIENTETTEKIENTESSETSPKIIEKEKNTEVTTSTTEKNKKYKKSTKRRSNDVKHVSRKLIMAWKLASEHPGAITWKEIAPVIDSVEFLSTHWKNDDRLKDIEPVAVEIVSQVNKIHMELNLRVFGMNRLRIITEEFLNLLKKDRDAFIKDTNEKTKNGEESVETEVPPSPSTVTDNKSEINDTNDTTIEKNEKAKKSETKSTRSKEELLDKLINSLTQLFKLLNEPADVTPLSSAPSSPRPSNTHISQPQKHKSKKRNLFSGFFSSSSDKKQSTNNNSSNNNSTTTLNNQETTTNTNTGLEVYKNNIVSEWQEYTRKFVEPNYLFKVCKCYLAANPSAIPPRASLIGQNWICVANEISMSLWNILKKREDDLASSLIFLTLYKHGSPQIIERAITTIGSQLPEHFYVRLEYALKLKEYDQFSKEEQLMLDSNYKPPEIQIQTPVTPSTPTLGKNSISEISHSGSTSKKDKKNNNSLAVKKEDDDEELSFADMLAM
ncbi:hypothetical protein U3516DRAFT_644928 [Neocallimastix sp. 'constans']|jgi:hypothetical protein